MVMVRRSELACRNDWAASLWEPAAGSQADDASPLRPLLTGPLPPANADDIRAIVAQDTVVPAIGEDVLLSEGRLVAEPIRQPLSRAQQHAPPAPPPELRSDVLRARVAYRENTRTREAATRQTATAEAGSDAQGAVVEGDTPENLTERQPPEQADEPQAPQSPGPARAPMLAAGGAREPGRDVISGEHVPGSDLGRWLGEMAEETARANAVAQELEVELDAEIAPAPEPAYPELELANLYRFADKPLPLWFRQDLPQVCRTCRDFRPSVDGQRGWCANRWAFPERTLVGEDDPAPCATAIGSWWASVDDVWLVAADISDHGRPTPLMDRFFPPKIAEKKRTPGAH